MGFVVSTIIIYLSTTALGSTIIEDSEPHELIQARLIPNVKLPVQVIYPGQIFSYPLSSLDPSHQYEVRISYPASTPAIFHMKLTTPAPQSLNLRRKRRLNTEKIFVNGGVDDGVVVNVWVTPEGISRDIDVTTRKTEFHIVVERVVAGIPESAFGMIIILICYIILAFCWIIPTLARYIEAVNSTELDTDEKKN